MKPEISHNGGDDRGLFHVTINGIETGPKVTFIEYCKISFWLQRSWPNIESIVLSGSAAKKKASAVTSSKRKTRKGNV